LAILDSIQLPVSESIKMTRKTFPYIPILLLFAFAISALVIHYSNIRENQGRALRESKLPFGYLSGKAYAIKPDAEKAGIKIGDRIDGINGLDLSTNQVFLDEELSKMRGGVPIVLTMSRAIPDGGREAFEATVVPIGIEKNFTFYTGFVAGFIFVYVLPTLCILLGFWVLFVRPADPLAWILLFVLLGLSSLSLEMYWDGTTITGAYQKIFFACWALAMLLFGIYFPERWVLDAKLPWLKWLLIIPLSFQLFLTLVGLLRVNTGIDIFRFIAPLANAYEVFGFFVNMIAIGLFFAALGYKSGTTKNPDARRRLRVMLYGTSLAITPSFLLVIYRLITQKEGSFFEIVPFWIGLTALLLMLLFPLTMAYVIVVYRAMDVSVVLRQGLQYGLATNGVRVLQLILLLGIIAGTLFIVRSYGESISAQIGFVVGGIALIPLIDLIAKRLRVWIDKRFFREAYNAEQILTELSDDVRTMVETKPLLETVASRISESLHVPQITLLMKNGTNFVPAYALSFDTPPVVSLSGESKSIKKLGNNQHIVLYDDMTEVTSTPTMSLNDRDQLRELNSQILLPVSAKNELSGIISLSPKRSEEPYTASDLRLLRSVATQTGFALENSRLTEAVAKEAAQKERLNAELEIAREVQERLFPQELPKVEGLEYYGACRPALGVGGDYYDFLELPGGKFGIAIGDVSGKGIGASLMMASLQASLRGQALHSGDDIAGLMTHVNTLVYEASTTNRYATFFYAQYDPSNRKLSYVNAGHNPPFLLRRSGEIVEVIKLEVGGAVVGMLPSMIVHYDQGDIQLEVGDMLVGFTDGISEAMNPKEEEWGEDALLEELKTLDGKLSEEILVHIVAAADKFADGAKQHDDMTMIVVRIVG
jgi:sigma-B regulation protein RsbU (phosphoserine phosphatase)